MTENATDQPDPAQAFEAVRRELSLLHSAVAGLAAEREKIPDYSETLARIAHALGEHNKRLAAIEQSRAISLSPAELVKEIVAAAETVRIEDRRMLDAARGALDQALGRVDGMIRRGQATDRQVMRERWHAAAGLFIGMLIWAVLPGAIARSLPTSWHVPEWMAARTMGVTTGDARPLSSPNRARYFRSLSASLAELRRARDAAKSALPASESERLPRHTRTVSTGAVSLTRNALSTMQIGL